MVCHYWGLRNAALNKTWEDEQQKWPAIKALASVIKIMASKEARGLYNTPTTPKISKLSCSLST